MACIVTTCEQIATTCRPNPFVVLKAMQAHATKVQAEIRRSPRTGRLRRRAPALTLAAHYIKTVILPLLHWGDGLYQDRDSSC